MALRVMIAGGGTGGHISPGLALVAHLRQRVQGVKILWVGVKGRREEDMVPRHNIPLVTLKLRGLDRSIKPLSIVRNLATLLSWLCFIPVIKARGVIREFRPDVVLGTGGYVCAPILVAAKMMKIRTWILEQNSVPGLTVRILSRIVDGVGVAYEETRRHLPSSAAIELVGNPVSPEIVTARREEGLSRFNLNATFKTLLVIGGSLGSKALNDVIIELINLDQDGKAYQGWQILHTVGKYKFMDIKNKTDQAVRYYPHPFIYDMHQALAAADLVLCRAGAMTLAEVTMRGLPAIVVPWPGAVRNHQYTNAQNLSEKGAAILVAESELSGVHLATILKEFSDHPEKLEKMTHQSRKMSVPDAAERIADLILASQ